MTPYVKPMILNWYLTQLTILIKNSSSFSKTHFRLCCMHSIHLEAKIKSQNLSNVFASIKGIDCQWRPRWSKAKLDMALSWFPLAINTIVATIITLHNLKIFILELKWRENVQESPKSGLRMEKSA